MIYIEKDAEFKEDFIVLDEKDIPITGLIEGDFTRNLYDPDKQEVANISGGIPVIIEELGSGVYRASFIPNKLGNWILLVYNTTYFPYGKGNNYICIKALNDSLLVLIKRILGLSQENYRLFNPQYDRNNNLVSGIIKTYPTANDCENNTNNLAEYKITANFDLRTNLMTSYKVKEQ